MGAKVVTGLRAIGILLLVWGILVGIGFIGGAIPPVIPGKTHGDASDADADAGAGAGADADAGAGSDAGAGADAGADGDAGSDAGSDAGADSVATADGGVLWRAAVCARSADQSALETAALERGQLVGDAEAELIVACGSEVHVVGFDGPRPLRVARLGHAGAAQAARPVIADVDGDGRNDLVLGHVDVDEAGSPLGGSLSVVLSTLEGSLKPPRAVAPIAVSGLAAADLDGRPGAEIGAVHWADGHGLRPSELWLFAGGAAIARRQRVRLGNDGHGLTILDLDADGDLDWVAGDVRGVHAFGVDGSAGVEPEHERVIALEAADVSGDGSDELFVVGTTIARVPAAAAPVGSAVEGPHGSRRLRIADVDRDGDADIVVVTREHIMLLKQDAGRFEQQAWITLPGTLRPHDALILPDQIIIVVSSVRGWELVAVELARTEVPAEEAPALRDAPLMLTL